MSDYFIAAGHDKLVSQDNFPASERTTKWGVPDHTASNGSTRISNKSMNNKKPLGIPLF